MIREKIPTVSAPKLADVLGFRELMMNAGAAAREANNAYALSLINPQLDAVEMLLQKIRSEGGF